MSIHKLTAGSGYDYLTRQVAAQDATEKGHGSLASYYSAKGEAPGTWVGTGMDGLAGLAAGDEVTAEQMRNLFGAGKHPLAEQLREQAHDAGSDEREQERATWLGTPFRVYANDVSEFRVEVAREIAEVNKQRGEPADALLPLEERARIRTAVATRLFRREYGRDPADARELAATIAKHSRPRTNAVAGYDLTFSPVKSVSTLWALADKPTAALIERAHQAAVKDALTYIEQNALFSREGTNGVRQVEVRGLIAAAFTHRDSRAGDPDLHTHVAVANKVQTRDGGRWLAIDGRLMFVATVAASETYNTSLERHLTDTLGVRFEARPNADPRKRPVRELVGVDPRLAERWSSRRASIETRRAELASQFQATHGRPPSPIESIQLAQQATLETREKKHDPRSLDEQRTTWSAQAREVLGGEAAVSGMLDGVLRPGDGRTEHVDAAWVRETASTIHHTLQERRSHWKRWHVEAEALRRVRGTDVRTDDVGTVVGLLVDEVLTRHSVPLARTEDDLQLQLRKGVRPDAIPSVLRRSDGTSVYTVAGSALFTSTDLLDAEARIVAHAGRTDGARVPSAVVDQALAASAEEGVPLNAGQATLVRQMATSGARLQLAIAPAGSGKTTAMRALADAWSRGGGQVVGLAPSAAAAAVLGENIQAPTDTMAKLLHHLQRGDALPSWAQNIGPRSLVVVDEAGMADTLSLDRLVDFVAGRGGSVRLVGDDQQLSAVGAGGVLRDVRATHGCLHLTELMRFADAAEGSASLALRDGQPEALGFYLDKNRVHVGDLTTMTDEVFTAWALDRNAGRDAIMLAPTRDLVGELNSRARSHRLAGQAPEQEVRLADGTSASVGDVVLTRANDRRLRTSATDWVKNGDRWVVTALDGTGALCVQHSVNGRTVTLPPEYVAASVDLGYASTIHTAQGVTADASHTLLTGQESRQLVYTAATRGRVGNHLYMEIVDDGDEHNLVRPDHIHPLTATDLLERVMARDESARSATTTRREAEDPAHLLGEAVARYVDSLYVGAEQMMGPEQVARLDATADDIVPNLTGQPAWPTLRAHLLLLSAQDDQDPIERLRATAQGREVDSAGDVAAVLDWRLDSSGLRNAGAGPLPWLPGVPRALADDGQWGPYLGARAARVRELRAQVVEQVTSAGSTPTWARDGQHRPDPALLADVAVWRAATQVPDTDRRPTGPPQLGKAAARWQRALDARLSHDHMPAMSEWGPVLHSVVRGSQSDPFTPVLAERLAAVSRAGIPVADIVRDALVQGPLPDDHGAGALWWRVSSRLSPAVAAQAESDHSLTPHWAERLGETVGAPSADELRASPWWPALVTTVDHALARGMSVGAVLEEYREGASDDVDPCQAMVWRLSLLSDPQPPTDQPTDVEDALLDEEPNPFWDDLDPAQCAPAPTEWEHLSPLAPAEPGPEPVTDVDPRPLTVAEPTEALLSVAAAVRRDAGVLPPTDRQVDAQTSREFDAATAPVSTERILELNRLAQDYWASHLRGSWAQTYLQERTGVDLTDDQWVKPGYAPAGWTNLTDHLRRHAGASDLELTEAGLSTTTRQGRLIDRFRDRLVLPIQRSTADGELEPIGFVARRHPDSEDEKAGPKYLNTPETPLFHKGAQLYVVRQDLLEHGASPALVEGPIDALAVSIAGGGAFVGMAPLGTSLTEEQAAELARVAHRTGAQPIVATDGDLAGQVAAQRDYWLLAQHAIVPRAVAMRPGSDPGALLELHGADALRQVLADNRPLAEVLADERLRSLEGMGAVRQATAVLAAHEPAAWESGTHGIAAATGVPVEAVRRELVRAVQRWSDDPRTVVRDQIASLSEVRERLTPTVAPAPAPAVPPHQPTTTPSPAPSTRRR